jgi:DNA-binding LacI/PurR family transcriptional regulator
MDQTLVAKIAQHIREDYIVSGRVEPGGRLPGIRELQARYEVSGTTVAHALSRLAAEGLVSKEHGRGTFVSESLPGEKAGPLEAIGFVMPGPVDMGVTFRMYHGVERACRQRGWDVITASANFDYATERDRIVHLRQRGCKGVVLNPVTRTRDQLRSDYLKTEFQDFPIVLLDVAYPEQGRSQVVFDNRRAGYEMTRLLLDEGHERIAFVDASFPGGGDPAHRSTADRLLGYKEALASAGKAFRHEDRWQARLIVSGHEDEAYERLREWRAQADRPTAVMALDDAAAYDYYHAAAELGIRVPQDLRITGFDNLNIGRPGRQLFPTTNPDFARGGELAVELLETELQSRPQAPTVYLLPVPLKLEPARPVRSEVAEG